MTENRLKGLFEALGPNEEHKDKLWQEITAKNGQQTKTTRKQVPIRSFRTAMLGVIAMLCLATTTAYAAAFLGLDVKFLDFLKPVDGEQERYLQNGAYVVGKQVVNENGTLEVKQVIGDNHLVYILMEFTAPEGTVLNAERYRFEGHLDFDAAGSYSAGVGFESLEDENPDDNKISLVMSYLLTDKSIIGKDVQLLVRNLEGAGAFPDEFETVISGLWKTKFKMDFQDISSAHQLNEDISLYGYKAKLTYISISPISVTLKMESAHAKEISEAVSRSQKEIGLNESSDTYPVTLNYKDGTRETTTLFTGMAQADYINDTITIIKTFTPIIHDKEIESVAFFDTVIPMN